MNGIYWWQPSSTKPSSTRRARTVDSAGEKPRESISFRPINDGGSFFSQHGATVLMCLGIAVFCAAGLAFMFLNEAMMLIGGTLYIGVLGVGLLVAALYPLQLFSSYRLIKGFDPRASEGAVEVTARVRAAQPDPVVVLRYKKKGSHRFISVPMSRTQDDRYSAFVNKSAVLGSDDEAHMVYDVDVADGGEAYDFSVISH